MKWLERVFIAALIWIMFCGCVVVGASAVESILKLMR